MKSKIGITRMVGGLMALATAALLAFATTRAGRAEGDAAAKPDRVFELRTYVAAPGKMEDLHKRFREHTNALFQKHGMTVVGYWTPTDGEGADDTLIYLLAHESREAAKKSWAAFGMDPDWRAAYKESEKDGKLTLKVESRFLNPTDYSPLR